MKKKQAAEKPDRHKKKGKTKPGLTFVERRRLAELKHMLAGTNKNAEKPPQHRRPYLSEDVPGRYLSGHFWLLYENGGVLRYKL